MKAKRKFRVTALLIAVILGVFVRPLYVYAADATVTFGSNWYNKKSGDTFPVGVYLKANAAIGDYHIEIKYDNLRLEYVDGADTADEESGVLILEGNQNSREIKFWIRFRAISGGEAYIEIAAAEATLRNSADGEVFNITEYDSAPVHLSGEDTAAEIEAQMAAEAERAEAELERVEAEQPENEQTGQEAGEEWENDGNGDNAGIDGQGEDGAGSNADTGQGTSGENMTEAGDLEQGISESDEGAGDGENGGNGETVQTRQEKRHFFIFNVYFIIVLAIILLIVLVEMVVWIIIKSARAKRKRKEEKKKKIEEKQNRYRKTSHSTQRRV